MGFATKNNYSGNGKQYKNFKLQTPKGDETTDNRYRLLPAKGALAEAGKWACYHRVHFGYKVRDRQDPTKLRLMTFSCVEEKDFKTDMVKVACDECDLIEKKEKALANTIKSFEAQNKTAEEIKLLTAPVKEWLDNHNVDRKWYMLVFNEAWEPGILQISHKCKKALDARIKELVEKKLKDSQGRVIDPLDLATGVFFNFRRQGKGIGVQDTVEFVKKVVQVEGEEFEKIAPAPVSEELANKALEVLPDLCDVVRVISPEQIGQLVNSTGDPEEVEAIFNAAQKRERSAPPIRETTKGVTKRESTDEARQVAASATREAAEEIAPASDPKPVEKPAEKPAEPKAETPAVDDEEAALVAQLAAARARKAAAAAAAAGPEKPAAATQDPKSLSNEKFAGLFQS